MNEEELKMIAKVTLPLDNKAAWAAILKSLEEFGARGKKLVDQRDRAWKLRRELLKQKAAAKAA